MDYYLQQQIDNVRYYADQQISEINRKAADEIRVLLEQYSAQVQAEAQKALANMT